MINRRDFLKSSSMLIAGGLAGSQLLSGCAPKEVKKAVGLQLYSVREAMKNDALGTLKAVAEMGYKNLETASYVDGKIYGMDPIEFKTVCEDLGMKVKSAHVGGQFYTKDNIDAQMEYWKKVIEDHAKMGASYVVQPSMSLSPDVTLDDLKFHCEAFNSIGRMSLAADGIMFGYHNHSFEWKELDGKYVYDLMLENTSPDHVFFEMDVYWLQKAGFSPVEYMSKYPDRFPVLHIKDEKEIGASGYMDFDAIYNKAYEIGLKDYFVEVERYDYEPIESVKMSYDFLNAAPYVK